MSVLLVSKNVLLQVSDQPMWGKLLDSKSAYAQSEQDNITNFDIPEFFKNLKPSIKSIYA